MQMYRRICTKEGGSNEMGLRHKTRDEGCVLPKKHRTTTKSFFSTFGISHANQLKSMFVFEKGGEAVFKSKLSRLTESTRPDRGRV